MLCCFVAVAIAIVCECQLSIDSPRFRHTLADLNKLKDEFAKRADDLRLAKERAERECEEHKKKQAQAKKDYTQLKTSLDNDEVCV